VKPLALERLRAAAEGLTVEEDAAAAHRSTVTVSYWRRKAVDDLGARNLYHAIALAYERGILGAPVEPVEPVEPSEPPVALDDEPDDECELTTTIVLDGTPIAHYRARGAFALVHDRSRPRRPPRLRRVEISELDTAFCQGRGCDRELSSEDRRAGDGLCGGCRRAETLPAQVRAQLAGSDE